MIKNWLKNYLKYVKMVSFFKIFYKKLIAELKLKE